MNPFFLVRALVLRQCTVPVGPRHGVRQQIRETKTFDESRPSSQTKTASGSRTAWAVRSHGAPWAVVAAWAPVRRGRLDPSVGPLVGGGAHHATNQSHAGLCRCGGVSARGRGERNSALQPSSPRLASTAPTLPFPFAPNYWRPIDGLRRVRADAQSMAQNDRRRRG